MLSETRSQTYGPCFYDSLGVYQNLNCSENMQGNQQKLLYYCYSQGHATANEKKLDVKSTGNTFSRDTTQAIPNSQNSVGSVLEKKHHVKQILNFPSQDHNNATE